MRLLELLELVDAGGDGGGIPHRVGDHLAIGVVLGPLVGGGVDIVAGILVCLPADEWLPKIEAHAGEMWWWRLVSRGRGGVVVVSRPKQSRKRALQKKRGEGAGDVARARW